MTEKMNAVEISCRILEEVKDKLSQVNPAQTDALIGAIRRADRVFVAGAGRSLLMIRGFAMRLMHLGLTVYVVGETVTPAITARDLLIIASGSGETGTLKVVAEKAKKHGARLALITIHPDSSIGALSDLTVTIPAPENKTSRSEKETGSVQPGGSTFEQSVLVLGDAMIIRMLSEMNVESGNSQIMSLHANLE